MNSTPVPQVLVVTTYTGEELRISTQDKRDLRRWKQSLRYVAGGGGRALSDEDDADSMESWPSSSSMDESEQYVGLCTLYRICGFQLVCQMSIIACTNWSYPQNARVCACMLVTVREVAMTTQTVVAGHSRYTGLQPSRAAPAGATGLTEKLESSLIRIRY